MRTMVGCCILGVAVFLKPCVPLQLGPAAIDQSPQQPKHDQPSRWSLRKRQLKIEDLLPQQDLTFAKSFEEHANNSWALFANDVGNYSLFNFSTSSGPSFTRGLSVDQHTFNLSDKAGTVHSVDPYTNTSVDRLISPQTILRALSHLDCNSTSAGNSTVDDKHQCSETAEWLNSTLMGSAAPTQDFEALVNTFNDSSINGIGGETTVIILKNIGLETGFDGFNWTTLDVNTKHKLPQYFLAILEPLRGAGMAFQDLSRNRSELFASQLNNSLEDQIRKAWSIAAAEADSESKQQNWTVKSVAELRDATVPVGPVFPYQDIPVTVGDSTVINGSAVSIGQAALSGMQGIRPINSWSLGREDPWVNRMDVRLTLIQHHH